MAFGAKYPQNSGMSTHDTPSYIGDLHRDYIIVYLLLLFEIFFQ